MATATAAESKTANVALVNPGRASVIAETSDGVQNIAQIVKASVVSAAGNQALSVPTYIGFTKPTTSDYPGAPIGSEYLEYTVDSTKTPTMYTARKWLLTAEGWKTMYMLSNKPTYEKAAFAIVTTAGGDTTETGLLTGALTTDVIEVNAYGLGRPNSAACATADNFICTLSADPGTTGKLFVSAWRAVS